MCFENAKIFFTDSIHSFKWLISKYRRMFICSVNSHDIDFDYLLFANLNKSTRPNVCCRPKRNFLQIPKCLQKPLYICYFIEIFIGQFQWNDFVLQQYVISLCSSNEICLFGIFRLFFLWAARFHFEFTN